MWQVPPQGRPIGQSYEEQWAPLPPEPMQQAPWQAPRGRQALPQPGWEPRGPSWPGEGTAGKYVPGAERMPGTPPRKETGPVGWLEGPAPRRQGLPQEAPWERDREQGPGRAARWGPGDASLMRQNGEDRRSDWAAARWDESASYSKSVGPRSTTGGAYVDMARGDWEQRGRRREGEWRGEREGRERRDERPLWQRLFLDQGAEGMGRSETSRAAASWDRGTGWETWNDSSRRSVQAEARGQRGGRAEEAWAAAAPGPRGMGEWQSGPAPQEGATWPREDVGAGPGAMQARGSLAQQGGSRDGASVRPSELQGVPVPPPPPGGFRTDFVSLLPPFERPTEVVAYPGDFWIFTQPWTIPGHNISVRMGVHR